MAAWLPQNIQRRLLLYFLQKISLFSQVDVSTLDVSLGSNSQFSFHHLDLDVESLIIPNVVVRSGYVKKLDLKLTVSGGVNVIADGLSFVLKPSPDDNLDTLGFSITKTVLDLTSSMVDIQNGEAKPLEAEDWSSDGEDSHSQLPKNVQPTLLQSMRNKGLEIALANLSVCVENATFTFLFPENITLEATLANATFKTSSERRLVDLQEFKVRCIRKFESLKDPHLPEASNESMGTSKTESTSLYLSALQTAPDPSEEEYSSMTNNCEVDQLFCINNAQMSFEGFRSVDDFEVRDLEVKIDTIEVGAYAFFTSNYPVLKTLMKIISLETSAPKVKAANLNNYKRFQLEQEMDGAVQFSSLSISRIDILLSSKLRLVVKNLGISRRQTELIQMSVNNIHFLFEGKKHECFSQVDELEILNFSFNCKTSFLDVNLYHELRLNICVEVLDELMDSFAAVSRALEDWQTYTSNKRVSSTNSRTLFHKINSRLILLTLTLPEGSLDFKIPSLESTDTNLLTMPEFTVTFRDKFGNHQKFSMKDVALRSQTTMTQTCTYDIGSNERLVSSKSIWTIKDISFSGRLEDIFCLCNRLQLLSTRLKEKFKSSNISKAKGPGPPRKNLKKSVRIMNASSITYKQSLVVKCVVKIDKIKIIIKESLGEGFGNIEGTVEKGIIHIPDDGDFTFCSEAIGLKRVANGEKELFISNFNFTRDVTKPSLLLHLKNGKTLQLILNTCSLYYHARLLDFLQDTKNQGENTNGKKTMHPEKTAPVTDNKSVELKLNDCALHLRPYRLKSELLIAVNRSILVIEFPSLSFRGSLKALSILLIDDLANIKSTTNITTSLSSHFVKSGFANLGRLDVVSLSGSFNELGLNCQVNAGTLFLSVCADSNHTLTQVLADLKPPISFSDDAKYQTRIPLTDVFEDVEPFYFTEDKIQSGDLNVKEESIAVIDDFFNQVSDLPSNQSSVLLGSTVADARVSGSLLQAVEGYFDTEKSEIPTANSGDDTNCNVSLSVSVSRLSIKLYDGFDWKFTRSGISELIKTMENEIRQNHKSQAGEQVAGSAFDSIYIFAPGSESGEVKLRHIVNEDIQSGQKLNLEEENEKLRLRPSKAHKALIDVQHLKITFKGFDIDGLTKSQSNESADTLNEIKLCCNSFEIIDNVFTSTWNKFLTRLKGETPFEGAPMLDAKIKTVRPIDFLAATEIILTVRVSPLRLHVDQDTLDFLIRFGEFRDTRFALIDEYPDILYFQKVEINSVDVKLDYKPKKVDYAGLKSGHTSELMNFFILDGSKIKLKHVVLYGVFGLPELNKALNKIWTPDITGTQLAGVLSGVAPMKTLVTLGTGIKALATLPVQEYKRDKPVIRGVQKGAQIFMKVATGEIVRLGVKVASGTQSVLENTEGYLGGKVSATAILDDELEVDLVSEATFRKYEKLIGGRNPTAGGSSDPDAIVVEQASSVGSPRVFSLYANQPGTIQKGLSQAKGAMERNSSIAYEAIKRAHREFTAAANAQESASSVAHALPVAILRPLIGVTEAISKTLQGLSNELNENQLQELEQKYKSRKR
ncbi:LAMI_0E00188g1_1 [Lachancea mirantina]|uniref:Autophagy-related protein 2 n=1 Tax=Lachancea mirantina TaxID=1230905 RepID=A0A1G4JIQ6_9SACH|nr:LAMI_0E00188g1_1 [Lachancea mirantina]